MKNTLLLLLILLFLFFIALPINNIEARRGCCSHHGGVCDCNCCDGTSLSATCVPYYPQCGASPRTKYKLLVPNHKLLIPEKDFFKQQPLPKNFATGTSKKNSEEGFIWWIIGIGITAYIFYTLGKRKK